MSIEPKKTGALNTRKLVIDSMLIATYYVLSLFSLETGTMKFTFEGMPILLGALLYGPADGAVIGLLGAFLAQLLGKYGLTPTTVLWILPHAARGFVTGLYARSKGYRLKSGETLFILLLSALLTTGLNTFALFVDAKIWHYYTKALVFGSLLWRVLTGLVMALVFSIVLPPLVREIRRYLGMPSREKEKQR